MPPILSSIAIATAKAYGFTSGSTGIVEFTADFLVIAGGGGGGGSQTGDAGGGGGAGGYRTSCWNIWRRSVCGISINAYL
jgi:hypothetical protein